MPSGERAPQPAFVPPANAVAQVAAPAKINLGLLVGPVRSDGYHEIFSPMLPVTLADLVAPVDVVMHRVPNRRPGRETETQN